MFTFGIFLTRKCWPSILFPFKAKHLLCKSIKTSLKIHLCQLIFQSKELIKTLVALIAFPVKKWSIINDCNCGVMFYHHKHHHHFHRRYLNCWEKPNRFIHQAEESLVHWSHFLSHSFPLPLHTRRRGHPQGHLLRKPTEHMHDIWRVMHRLPYRNKNTPRDSHYRLTK